MTAIPLAPSPSGRELGRGEKIFGQTPGLMWKKGNAACVAP